LLCVWVNSHSYGLCTGLEKAIARGSKFRRLYFSYR